MAQDGLSPQETEVKPPPGYQLLDKDSDVKPPKGYLLLKSNSPAASKKIGKKTVKELKIEAAKRKPVVPPKGYVLQSPKYDPSKATGELRASPKSFWEQAREAVANTAIGHSLEETLPSVADALHLRPTETKAGEQRHRNQFLAPEYLAPALTEAIRTGPLTGAPAPPEGRAPDRLSNTVEGGLRAVGGLTTPDNLALMSGMGAVGAGIGEISPVAARVLGRVASGAFTVQMLKGLYDQSKAYRAAVDAGDVDEAQKIQGEMGVNGIMALLAGKHALIGHPFTPVTEPVTRQRTNILHDSPSGQVRQKPGEAPSVWLEPDAWQAYMEAMHPGEDHTSVNGVVLAQRDDLPSILTDPNASKSPHWPEVQKILSVADKASGDEGIAVGVKRRKGIKHAVNIMREELNHTAQRKVAGSLRGLVPEGVYDVLHKAIPKGMATYLEDQGYDLAEPVTTVSEAAAKLMGNKAEDFGVTPAEKKAFLKLYFTEIAKNHGSNSLDNFTHLVDNSKAIKEQVHAEHSGKETASGTNEGLADNRTDGSTLQSLFGGGRRGVEQIHRPTGIQVGSGTDIARTASGNFLEQVEGGWIEHKPNNGGLVFHHTNPNVPAGEQVSPAADTLFNRERDEPIWYLKSERLIGEKMRGPMPAQDVSKMLLASGVKPEEMHWTGLDDFLAAKGNSKVTPQEIKDHLAANNLQIKEVTKGNDVDLKALDKKIRSLSHWPDDATKARNPEDQAKLDELNEEWERENTKADSPTKYGSYVLPGGEPNSYREMLLTLPPTPRSIEHWRINRPDGYAHSVYDNEGAARKEAERLGEGYTVERRPDVKVEGGFKSGHWEEPNILAHVRFNDRVGPNGEKLLHVEELQSDAHQQARTKGYRSSYTTDLDAAKKEHEGRVNALAEADKTYSAAREETKKATGSGLSLALEAEEKAKQVVLDAMREERSAASKYESIIDRNKNAVPDMPWKRNWHEQALRRMVRYAVDHNYDGVSWTGGTDQADRYSLARQVNRLQYTDDGKLIAYGHHGDYKDLGIVPEDKLPDYIGKESARKLLEQPAAEKHGEGGVHPGDRVLEGVDLKVGGSGMRGFYDKIVPDFLNKFGKKYGARVGTTEIESDSNKYSQYKGPEFSVSDLEKISKDRSQNGSVRDQADDVAYAMRNGIPFDKAIVIHGSPALASELNGYLVPEGKSRTVQYLPITPEMRKSVGEEGVPLFNREQVKSPEFRNWFDGSAVTESDGKPKVMYHGTSAEDDFDTFKTNPRDIGMHFGNEGQANKALIKHGKSDRAGARILPVYLNIKNPLRMEDINMWSIPNLKEELKFMFPDESNEISKFRSKEDVRKFIKGKGHDGIVYDNYSEGPGDSYITFDPEQIKSAIGNSGKFDTSDPSILRNREKPSSVVNSETPQPEAEANASVLGGGATGSAVDQDTQFERIAQELGSKGKTYNRDIEEALKAAGLPHNKGTQAFTAVSKRAREIGEQRAKLLKEENLAKRKSSPEYLESKQELKDAFGDEWDEMTEDERHDAVEADLDRKDEEREEEEQRQRESEEYDRQLEKKIAYMDEKQQAVEDELKKRGFTFTSKGRYNSSRYITVNHPDEDQLPTTIRISDHEPAVGIRGGVVGGYNVVTGDRHDAADLSIHPGEDDLSRLDDVLPENPNTLFNRETSSAAGQSQPTSIVPVQGNTVVTGAPIMIPSVPVPTKVPLPLHKLKEMAAARNPNVNPQPQVRSVRELMAEARSRMVP